jgi:RimJ/RimL family protein N-acetyltransferase
LKFERSFDVVDNIQLRPFTDSDAPEFARAVLESLDTLAPWMPWAHTSYTTQDALDWFAMCRASQADESAYEFGIFSRNDDRLLGGCGLNQFNRQHGFCNLGYWIRHSNQRQGVATTCVNLLSQLAFSTYGFHRVEIVTATDNEASAGVALKAGATFECIARNRLQLHGKPIDAKVFSLVP